MDYEKTLVMLTVGKVEKERADRARSDNDNKRELQLEIFARALLSVGGTYEFTDEHKKIGYLTIFEAMAADLHDPAANIKTKIQNGEAFEHVYRNGCSALNARLMTEWDNFIVYTLPRTVNDKVIQVITMDGTLVINSLGQTAAQVNQEREQKRATGQLSASARKLTRSVGRDNAMNVLSKIVMSVGEMTSIPPGTRSGEPIPSLPSTVA
jgi:hypothetical protein